MTQLENPSAAVSAITAAGGVSADTTPVLLHLTASPCHGGPERQMLELGRELAPDYRTVYATFREEERCWGFVRAAQASGFPAFAIEHDMPRLCAAYRELVALLQDTLAVVLLCHGYKACILGRLAARRAGIPAVAVSRGWTGESLRVRLFDRFDRLNLRFMDRVVCVCEAQARKVRRYGVRPEKVTVIHNAIRIGRFDNPMSEYRERLRAVFPAPPRMIVGAAGRLSPEKGFDLLVAAAAEMAKTGERHSESDGSNGIGFVLFGDGAQRDALAQQIAKLGLDGRFILAGFHDDLDRYLPHLDIAVLPSHTEGLPNAALEAMAARVPVVATAVGGTPELVDHGATGLLVPPGDPRALAAAIAQLAADATLRFRLGAAGRRRVEQEFSFPAQAGAYRILLASLREGFAVDGHPAVLRRGECAGYREDPPGYRFLNT